MITTKAPQRGAFNYLLNGMNDEVPPPRGGGPRVHVQIELVERRPPPQRRSYAVWWWLLLILVLAFAGCGNAHAESCEDRQAVDPTACSIQHGPAYDPANVPPARPARPAQETDIHGHPVSNVTRWYTMTNRANQYGASLGASYTNCVAWDDAHGQRRFRCERNLGITNLVPF